jgi:thiol:disulfide interchange protein DsbA
MKKYLFVIIFCLTSIIAHAKIVQGKDYVALPFYHTSHAKQVEVLEFFSYHCSHCFQLSLKMDAMKWPSYVKLHRIQVMWGKQFDGLTRLLATIEKMGKTRVLHHRVFLAFLEQGVMLADKYILFGWIKKQPDINFKQFVRHYNSAAAVATSDYYAKKTKEYAVDETPTIIVGGKYRVLPSSPTRMVAVTRELTAKISRQK